MKYASLAILLTMVVCTGCQHRPASRVPEGKQGSFSRKVDSQRWIGRILPSDEYAVEFVPEGSDISIYLCVAEYSDLSKQASEKELLDFRLIAPKKYEDPSISAKKAGNVVVDFGNIPVFAFNYPHPSRYDAKLIVMYQTSDGMLVDVGFAFPDNELSIENVQHYMNQMRRANLIPKGVIASAIPDGRG